MSRHGSPQGPEENARLADDYPSPNGSPTTAQAIEAAVQLAVAQDQAQHEDLDRSHVEAEEHHPADPTDPTNPLDTLHQAELRGQDVDMTPMYTPSQAPASPSNAQPLEDSNAAANLEGISENNAIAGPSRPSSHRLALHTFYTPTPQNRAETHAAQIAVLREAFEKNPLPSRREYEILAERTGRPWKKVREYFRQRRSKGRGAETLEVLDEPARAAGWLRVMYRSAPTSSVTQLGMYGAYKARFDPYSSTAPLLGGQELVNMAMATFPGCRLARDEGTYLVRGLGANGMIDGNGQDEGERIPGEGLQEGHGTEVAVDGEADSDGEDMRLHTETHPSLATEIIRSEEGIDAAGTGNAPSGANLDHLVEPIRATSWLLGEYAPGQTEPVSQSELYTSYSSRFETSPHVNDNNSNANQNGNGEQHRSAETRILNPVELLQIARITFPSCTPAVDEEGRFVVRGLEKRTGVKVPKVAEMFPFALMHEPNPSDPTHPFTSLLKRKLVDDQDERERDGKRSKLDDEHYRELIEGLERFRRSKLGEQVRDVCISQ